MTHSVSTGQHLWTCITVFQRSQQLKHFLIEYHYYKRSLCVRMSVLLFSMFTWVCRLLKAVVLSSATRWCLWFLALSKQKNVKVDLALICPSLQLFRGNIRSWSKLSDKKRTLFKVFFFFNNRITIFSTDNPTEDRNNLKRKEKKQHNDKWLEILHSTNAP